MFSQVHKSSVAMLTVGVLIFGLLLPFHSSTSVQAQGQTTNDQPQTRTVSVSGTGYVQAVPDMATITIGVQTDADTARNALTQNNQKMQDVLSSLSSAGVASADIRTSSVQLYPRYKVQQPVQGQSQTDQSNQIAGFTATNLVEVTVRNLDNMGTLLDQVVTAGGNQIQNIQFDISDKTAALDKARQAAWQDAQQKAQQLASLADSQLGQVMTISENSQVPVPFMEARASQANAAVPISPGSQQISVNLQVTWELQ